MRRNAVGFIIGFAFMCGLIMLAGCSTNPVSDNILSTARAQAHVEATRLMCKADTISCVGTIDDKGWSITSTSKF